MAEAQKICDKEMHGIRSIRFIQCCFDRKNRDRIHKIKYVNDIIQDLEHYGPAGLIHIVILSCIIEKPIKIWNANGNLNKIIGRKKSGYPIDVEYHANEGIGHWTLRGGKDPDNVVTDLNSCLFTVVGSQIGQDPLRLRKWTVLKLKNSFQNLVQWIDKILQVERSNEVILMIGGASYTGTSPRDAKRILDNSEGQIGESPRQDQATPRQVESQLKFQFTPVSVPKFTYQFANRAHPRGHAFHVVEGEQSVVKYSKRDQTMPKTGFLSRAQQDYVVHLALQTKTAQRQLELLNTDDCKERWVTIAANNLEDICSYYKLPKIKGWVCGKEHTTEMDMQQIVLVLRHHKNKIGEPKHDVLIQTCYPQVDIDTYKAHIKPEAMELCENSYKRKRKWLEQEQKRKEREEERRQKEGKIQKGERERKEKEKRKIKERKEDEKIAKCNFIDKLSLLEA